MPEGADDPTSDDHADLSARIDAASALNRLSHALVGHRAAPEVLERIATAADELAAGIEQEPVRQRGMEIGASPGFLQAVAQPQTLADVVDGGAFLDMFDDSPVSGSANPLSIGLRIRREGDQAVGVVTLDRGWEGAPGRSHGGIVASCVDETLGGLLPVIGEMAFTGELSLRYEGPCPMGVPLEFRAWLDRREGRKLHLHCTGSADGAVFVRATALFITVDLERFRANG
ncbi:MAG TPA: PaaI family thioesterase [Acidimicrobiales bacterium]